MRIFLNIKKERFLVKYLLKYYFRRKKQLYLAAKIHLRRYIYMKYNLLLFLALFCSHIAMAQSPAPIRVYLDRFNAPSSPNYLRTVLQYVHYTDQPADCDVRIQLTEEFVGNGTSRYMLFFYGEKQFQGQNDTVFCVVPPMTNSLVRENTLVETLKRGLLPYLLQAGWSDFIDVSMDGAEPHPWFQDYWNLSTFAISFSGRYSNSEQTLRGANGEEITPYNRSGDLNTDFNWWKVGQTWRYSAGFNSFYTRSSAQGLATTFPLSLAPSTIEQERQSMSGGFGGVRRLTDRWSAGVGTTLSYNDGLNQKASFSGSLSAGVEYNLFPYSEFFRRHLLLGYTIGATQYRNTNGLHPTAQLPQNQLSVQYSQRFKRAFLQCFASSGIRFSSKIWNVWQVFGSVRGGVELKRNLFLTLSSNVSANNGNALPGFNDLYTNRARALGYNGEIGMTYLFGSGYRNILNPGLAPLFQLF
jgi:hypothetical protein